MENDNLTVQQFFHHFRNIFTFGLTGQFFGSNAHDLAQILVQKIVHPSLLRLPLRLPFATCIFKVAHQFLFLGVHRDDRVECGRQRH